MHIVWQHVRRVIAIALEENLPSRGNDREQQWKTRYQDGLEDTPEHIWVGVLNCFHRNRWMVHPRDLMDCELIFILFIFHIESCDAMAGYVIKRKCKRTWFCKLLCFNVGF